MIKITCAAGWVSAFGNFDTIAEADAALAALPKGLFYSTEFRGVYQVGLSKKMNLNSNNATGEKNEAAIARINKILKSGIVEYSNELSANSISEDEFLNLIK